jgi:hypothetical protein
MGILNRLNKRGTVAEFLSNITENRWFSPSIMTSWIRTVLSTHTELGTVGATAILDMGGAYSKSFSVTLPEATDVSFSIINTPVGIRSDVLIILTSGATLGVLDVTGFNGWTDPNPSVVTEYSLLTIDDGATWEVVSRERA